MQLVAQPTSNIPSLLNVLDTYFAYDVGPGRLVRRTYAYSDREVTVSPFELALRNTPRKPSRFVEIGPVTSSFAIQKPALEIVELMVPDVIEPGSIIEYEVENISPYPWNGSRADELVLSPQSSSLGAPGVTLRKWWTGRLLPGESQMLTIAVPDQPIGFVDGLVTIRLGVDEKIGAPLNPEQREVTLERRFSGSDFAIELLEGNVSLSTGSNSLEVRVTNHGTVSSQLPRFETQLATGGTRHEASSELVEGLEPGRELGPGQSDVFKVPIFVQPEFIGADSLYLNFEDYLNKPLRIPFSIPVAPQSLAVSDLDVNVLANLDIEFSWKVTNVGTTSVAQGGGTVFSPSGITSRGGDVGVMIAPGESYRVSVVVPGRRLRPAETDYFHEHSGSERLDADYSDNFLMHRMEVNYPDISMSLAQDSVVQVAHEETFVAVTITNESEMVLEQGQSFRVIGERLWRNSAGRELWSPTTFVDEFETRTPLLPGESVEAIVTIPGAEHSELASIVSAEVTLEVQPNWFEFDTLNNQVSFESEQVEIPEFDLAVSDVEARLVDLDRELVEVSWVVTNAGDAAIDSPLNTRIRATRGYVDFEEIYALDGPLEVGQSVQFVETIHAENVASVTGITVLSDAEILERTSSNNFERVVVDTSDRSPIPMIKELQIYNSGEALVEIRNEGQLPWRGGNIEFLESLLDDPESEFESIDLQLIDWSDDPLLGGESRTFRTMVELSQERLMDFGRVSVKATIGGVESPIENVFLSTHTRPIRTPRVKIQRLSLPVAAMPGEWIEVDLSLYNRTSDVDEITFEARSGDERLDLVLDIPQPPVGEFTTTARLRIPGGVEVHSQLDLRFDLFAGLATPADTVYRSLEIARFDLLAEQFSVELSPLATNLSAGWSVRGTQVHQSEPWHDVLYLSDDPILDPSDRFLGSVQQDFSAFDPAMIYRSHAQIAIEEQLRPGEWYVILDVNALRTRNETEFANNRLSQLIVVAEPSFQIQLARSSDTGWSDQDGVTRHGVPEFVVTAPIAGELRIDFNGGIFDLWHEVTETGIVRVRRSLRDGEYHVRALLVGENETLAAEVAIEVDTEGPRFLTQAIEERPLPVSWLRVPFDEPVYSETNSAVLWSASSSSAWTALPQQMPRRELVTPIQGIRDPQEHSFYFVGIRDLAGNELTRSFSLDVTASDCSFTNPVEPADVNGDGRVSAVDALIAINELPLALRGGRRQPTAFYDVNCSGTFSPADPLMVINQIARQEAESEAVLFTPIVRPSDTQSEQVRLSELPTKTPNPNQSADVSTENWHRAESTGLKEFRASTSPLSVDEPSDSVSELLEEQNPKITNFADRDFR